MLKFIRCKCKSQRNVAQAYVPIANIEYVAAQVFVCFFYSFKVKIYRKKEKDVKIQELSSRWMILISIHGKIR